MFNYPLKFIKMHGLGNDFIVVDALDKPIKLTAPLIKFLCNRHLGIGANQLLLIEPATHLNADFDYRIFNQDGNEVEHCGNGARCIVKYLYKHYALVKESIVLHTKKHLTKGWLCGNDAIVELAVPTFIPDALPFLQPENQSNVYHLNILDNNSVSFGVVSVGNPHIMLKLDTKEELSRDSYLATIAIAIQRSAEFPKGVNVNFYYLKDRQTLWLRTYERGCGFTQACGTGACATVAYAIVKEQCANSVNVLMPGGTLCVAWHGVGTFITMRGSAVEVFSGEINLCN